MLPNQSSPAIRLLPRVRQAAATVVFQLGRPATRLAVLGLLGTLLLYLLYSQVWQPLNRPTELPPGVTDTALEVNAALLQQISADRVTRTQSPRQDFTAAPQLIGPPPRPAAAP